MRGAIVGDIIGSAYEFHPIKTKVFELFPESARFTDDSILTAATAVAIMEKRSYKDVYADFATRYPKRGYGQKFYKWIASEAKEPYNSFGNGSAMRVAPVGWAYDNLKVVMYQAERSAEVTHNHPQGIIGAQAVAVAIYLARNGCCKDDIKNCLRKEFKYDIGYLVDDIRKAAIFDETCPRSVEQAIDCFLQSTSYEDAVRNAVSLGADADTQACIAGAIAEAFYGAVPIMMRKKANEILNDELRSITDRFCLKY